jgi:putative alpha-1,2-mannosidase
VNPAGEEYIVATPLFPSITVRLPSPPHNASSSAPRLPDRVLRILAPGAGTYREVKPYIRSLSINGRNVDRPVIRHEEIFSTSGRDVEIVFEMSDRPTRWGRR